MIFSIYAVLGNTINYFALSNSTASSTSEGTNLTSTFVTLGLFSLAANVLLFFTRDKIDVRKQLEVKDDDVRACGKVTEVAKVISSERQVKLMTWFFFSQGVSKAFSQALLVPFIAPTLASSDDVELQLKRSSLAMVW